MSKKLPIRQNDIQPTFKGFLHVMKSKHDVQSRYEQSLLIKWTVTLGFKHITLVKIENFIRYNPFVVRFAAPQSHQI